MPSLADVFAHINVVDQFLQREDCPRSALIQPGSRTDRIDVRPWDELTCLISRDPQDFLLALARVAVAHGFHRVNQTCLWVEPDHKVLLPLLEGDIQQRRIVVDRFPTGAWVSHPQRGEPTRLSAERG